MKPNTLWEYRLRPEDSGQKYLSILKHKFHFSLKVLQHLKQGERVKVDGQFTYLTARGKEGELLTLELALEEDSPIEGEDLPLDVLYEDDYLMAVNKPVEQVVHPNHRYPCHTLGNAVIGYWQRRGEQRLFRPIHRIDRNTSGVVLIAKNQFAHQQLAWQLERGHIHKRYLGFVQGNVAQDSGIIDAPLGLAPNSFIKREISASGEPARTDFRVIRRYAQVTLLEFILVTGRTHQVRAHCRGIGHPLLGDDLYDGDTSLIQRQALHSSFYAFLHPATGQPQVIRAPFPADLRQLLKELKLPR